MWALCTAAACGVTGEVSQGGYANEAASTATGVVGSATSGETGGSTTGGTVGGTTAAMVGDPNAGLTTTTTTGVGTTTFGATATTTSASTTMGTTGGAPTTTGGSSTAGTTAAGTTTGTPTPTPTPTSTCAETWTNYAQNLITTRCANCHSSLSSYLVVTGQATIIRNLIAKRSMPKGSTLSDQDYKKILDWFDCNPAAPE